jgi:hypothetical protein
VKIFFISFFIFLSLGCRSIINRNYIFKPREQEFLLEGSLILKGYGIKENCFKDIDFYLPGEPYKAFLYRGGRNSIPLKDRHLYIEGKAVLGELIYAEDVNRDPAYNRYVYTLCYDITSFVKREHNHLKIWGFSSFSNEGLGLAVLYRDEKENLKRIVLHSGLGFFWSGLEDLKRHNSPLIELDINPEKASKEARIFMFLAGGSESPRDENVWIKRSPVRLSSSIISASELLFENEIASKDGPEWDSLEFNLSFKEEERFLYIEIESLDFTLSEHNGDSLNFVLLGAEIPLAKE